MANRLHFQDARTGAHDRPGGERRPPSRRTLFTHLLFTPEVVWPLLRLFDAGIVAACGIGSFYVRHDQPLAPLDWLVVIATTLVAANTLGALRLYDRTAQPTGFMRRLRTALVGWAIAVVIMLVLGWATKTTGLISRIWIGTWMLSGAAGLLGVRLFEAWVVERATDLGLLSRRLGIVIPPTQQGTDAFQRLLSRFLSDPNLEACGVYHVDPEAVREDSVHGIPVRGSLSALEEDIADGLIQEVLIVSPREGDVLDARSINAIRRLPVRCALVIDAHSPPGLPQSVIEVGGLPALQVASQPLSNGQLALKRSFDIVVAGLLVLGLAPLFLLTALAIRLESPGPVFFRQERQGFAGERFSILKFRSMRHDLCDTAGRRSTQRGDPRITRVGRFIRRTSIDELPQLFNVLAGEMSLVGPRPHALGSEAEGELFWDAVDEYHARHRVKPGITGWAQVNGWRGATDTQEQLQKRVQYDLWYVDHWSLLLDVKILFMTLLALSGARAY